jgi:hypothetical protein
LENLAGNKPSSLFGLFVIDIEKFEKIELLSQHCKKHFCKSLIKTPNKLEHFLLFWPDQPILDYAGKSCQEQTL